MFMWDPIAIRTVPRHGRLTASSWKTTTPNHEGSFPFSQERVDKPVPRESPRRDRHDGPRERGAPLRNA